MIVIFPRVSDLLSQGNTPNVLVSIFRPVIFIITVSGACNNFNGGDASIITVIILNIHNIMYTCI